MERWAGRVALITGASAGIGAAILKRLVRDGMKVVGCARNVERIENLATELKKENAKGTVTAIKCDVSKEEDIMNVFKKIRSEFGVLHVCINNAGLGHDAPLLTGEPEKWKELLEVNVLGLCIFTKEAVNLMRESNVDDGQIIQMSSMSGHRIPGGKTNHMYSATKTAVRVLTEGVRRELRELNSHIRVSSISPALVTTEFHKRMYAHDKEMQAKKPEIEYLTVDDIVDTTIYIMSAPARMEVNDVLIRSTDQKT